MNEDVNGIVAISGQFVSIYFLRERIYGYIHTLFLLEPDALG